MTKHTSIDRARQAMNEYIWYYSWRLIMVSDCQFKVNPGSFRVWPKEDKFRPNSKTLSFHDSMCLTMTCTKNDLTAWSKFTGLQHTPRLTGANFKEAYRANYASIFIAHFFQICYSTPWMYVRSCNSSISIADPQWANPFSPRVIRSNFDEFSKTDTWTFHTAISFTP